MFLLRRWLRTLKAEARLKQSVRSKSKKKLSEDGSDLLLLEFPSSWPRAKNLPRQLFRLLNRSSSNFCHISLHVPAGGIQLFRYTERLTLVSRGLRVWVRFDIELFTVGYSTHQAPPHKTSEKQRKFTVESFSPSIAFLFSSFSLENSLQKIYLRFPYLKCHKRCFWHITHCFDEDRKAICCSERNSIECYRPDDWHSGGSEVEAIFTFPDWFSELFINDKSWEKNSDSITPLLLSVWFYGTARVCCSLMKRAGSLMNDRSLLLNFARCSTCFIYLKALFNLV